MRWAARAAWLGAALTCATVATACGAGNAHMRAQGARYSDVPDAEPSRYAGREPVVVLEGQATYYSDSLAGNHTANGEIYDPRRMTAASRDLPFGSIVRVTRLDTGRSTLVRVNDRGPFGSKKRILDLSRAAAEELGIIQRGWVNVRADVLELGPKRASKRKRRR